MPYRHLVVFTGASFDARSIANQQGSSIQDLNYTRSARASTTPHIIGFCVILDCTRSISSSPGAEGFKSGHHHRTAQLRDNFRRTFCRAAFYPLVVVMFSHTHREKETIPEPHSRNHQEEARAPLYCASRLSETNQTHALLSAPSFPPYSLSPTTQRAGLMTTGFFPGACLPQQPRARIFF